MSTVMRDIKTLINHLPEDSSIEDVQYNLYVLEKIRRGRKDISDGKHYTTEQARERLRRWLNP